MHTFFEILAHSCNRRGSGLVYTHYFVCKQCVYTHYIAQKEAHQFGNNHVELIFMIPSQIRFTTIHQIRASQCLKNYLEVTIIFNTLLCDVMLCNVRLICLCLCPVCEPFSLYTTFTYITMPPINFKRSHKRCMSNAKF